MMLTRKYLEINLPTQAISEEIWQGEALVKAGRYLIAKKLVEAGTAVVDPLGAENPLIFSVGPFAGTTFSNANRTSVGCKSPLTGGIKEANGGGTFAYALGRLGICGFTLHGQASDWIVIHIQKDGQIRFEDASPYLGKDNYVVANMLHQKYGKKVSLALCGPVGEYQGLLAGVAFSDTDNRPSRLAARGGVGAVMGSKKVKAIVVDLHTMPQLHDRKKTLTAVKQYATWVREDPIIQTTYNPVGTMGMADFTNHIGGIPVNNFTSGSQPLTNDQFPLGGTFITELNNSRGGKQTHACMPGCVIQCSNVYADENGQELTSPVEYETIALLGTNCGLTHPDNLARMNQWCNELGIDTIETGATIGVLMDAGLADFGDTAFMEDVFQQMLQGTESGQLYAQGTYRVGQHLGFQRVPTIKKQAISAYDPRVIEVTGISMMMTAQGADHTAGNVPKMKTRDKALSELIVVSLEAQIATAATDSIGLCVFGRSVTNPHIDFLANAINHALGTNLQPTFFHKIGRETLRLEREFSLASGFTAVDDDLPQFFYDEPLPPSQQTARFRGVDVHEMYERLPEVGAERVPEAFGGATP
ncbi:aldehyde ferredoxin oxidoreductase C-terminal domain-containing protein [Candidatus Leptofilum sp.]|uniref:aldehyde ferredoxin oxidoreductase C-terminal domain-containing protein n=1 Tax=Candidatus Leptofilum sp. TaxID=3241576 RepID=UPI003B5BD49A